MLDLLFISFNIFTTVVTAKSELYQIEWFHSDTVNIESILCQARYSQKNLSKQILMFSVYISMSIQKKTPLKTLSWQLLRTSSLTTNMLLYASLQESQHYENSELLLIFQWITEHLCNFDFRLQSCGGISWQISRSEFVWLWLPFSKFVWKKKILNLISFCSHIYY